MKVEALSRVAAEADLRKRHALEFQRLLKKREGNEVAAVADLVSKHDKEYARLVTEARERLAAQSRAQLA